MKKLSILTAMVLLIAACALASNPDVKTIDRPDMQSFLGWAPGQLIVKFKIPADQLKAVSRQSGFVSVGEASLDAIAERYDVTGMRAMFPGAQPMMTKSGTIDLSRHYVVEFDPRADLDKVLEEYRNDPNVESVEKNGIHALYATPNDGYYSYQWHLNQTNDHDIDAPEAWDIETGATSVIIALLDSGTRYYHPDLGGANASVSNPGASRGNMWINDAELNGSSGVDDDGNGYVDDWIGWDFIDGVSNCWSGEDCNTEDNDPRDFNGHGTHTAGIMGMISNDGYGMCGVAGGWNDGSQSEYGNGIKVMALRMGYSYNYYGTEYGVVMMDAAASAFYYAANNGAKIASCSWGSSNSGGLGSAVDYFIAAGGIVVVAAGNDGTQTADYLNGRGDCISVAATGDDDDATSWTTYGTWVDICAPGDAIYSTYHDHTDASTIYWAAISGTSMSTPMVAGVVGLIWSKNPTWSASEVESQLYSSADNIDAYLSSTYIGKMGAGRINAYNAVNTGVSPPSAGFSGTPTSGCAPLTVAFTDESTGDDISSWSWDFGDGGTSSAQNPSHEYTSGGTYTVELTVTNPGGSDTETKTDYITVNVAPTAAFVGSPTSGTEPLTVNFTDQSTGAASWDWDFGDGGSSTSQSPSHTYTSSGTYTVALTATNACGSDTETKTDYITVDPCVLPVADFSGTPTSGEVPLTVTFSDASTGATSWDWDFGDGGSSTAQSPSHTYTSAGTYTVALTATNSCGNDTETKTDYITVTCTAPVADFSGTPTSGEVPLTVTFTDASTGATSWDWDFGDGGSSTSQSPSHTYTSAGTYTVALTATNSCGSDTETKTDYITVTCTAPTAAFSGTPTSGDAPLTVTFTDASTGATSWDWDFGDGGSSTAQNPSYAYTSAGTYTVALTATNSCGSDTETKTDYITVTCTAPTADFSGTPTSGNTPLTVTFTDASTGATSWDWDFGDGGSSTAQNPSYTYTSVGTYTVVLTVTNSCGSDTETKTDYITVSESEGFCDDFEDGDVSDWTILSGDWSVSGGQLDGYTSSGYAYIMSPVGDVSDATITVDWTSLTGGSLTNGLVVFGYADANNYRLADFRDGANRWYIREVINGTTYTRAQYAETINTNQQYAVEVVIDPGGLVTVSVDGDEKVSYSFSSVQTGQVGLAVDRSHSQFDNFCIDAEAPPPSPPTAEFVGSPTSGDFPLEVNFTDQSTDDPTSWYWVFGDGGTSTAQNPSHTYTAAGTYTVTLTATNAYGSDDEVKTDYITVTSPPPPTAEFSGEPTSGVYPLTVSFTDESTDSPTSWDWDFGDGGTSTAQNPTYEYTSPGVYTVTLTATNDYGSDEEVKTDYITVSEYETWTTITYDDFESGWGSYSDGGRDCSRYTGGTYAHEGNAALDIQDNSGTSSSFYHTSGHDVSGYTELEVEFWFMAVSMESGEDFWVQYYDGSSWQTVATYARGTDFDNNVFYNEVVTISSSQYNFPSNARLRFMCDASGDWDDVYIDEIEFRGMSGTSSLAKINPVIPESFALSQNYPNPFNPVTTIAFSLPVASDVAIDIYNVLGQRVATVADGHYQAGEHSVEWDATRNASGIYFYRIQAGEFTASRKMVLLK